MRSPLLLPEEEPGALPVPPRGAARHRRALRRGSAARPAGVGGRRRRPTAPPPSSVVGPSASRSASLVLTRPRSALVSPRCRLASRRRSFEPRVGFVGRRGGGGGASASRTTAASRSRAATRLRCCDRCSEASTTRRPATRRARRRRSSRRALGVVQRGRRRDVPLELHPAVGGVHRLPARPRRAREPFDELGRRHARARPGCRGRRARAGRRRGCEEGTGTVCSTQELGVGGPRPEHGCRRR